MQISLIIAHSRVKLNDPIPDDDNLSTAIQNLLGDCPNSGIKGAEKMRTSKELSTYFLPPLKDESVHIFVEFGALLVIWLASSFVSSYRGAMLTWCNQCEKGSSGNALKRILSPKFMSWKKVWPHYMFQFFFGTLTPFLEYAEAVEHGKQGIAPSSGTWPKELVKQQKDHPIYNGRPYYLHGPPIYIYHPVFGRFQDNIRSEVNPSNLPLKETHELFDVASEIFVEEESRVDKMTPIILKMLGVDGLPRVEHGDKTKAGGSVLIGAIEGVVFEFKVELGRGDGDPAVQAAMTIRKGWVQNQVRIPFAILSW